MRLPIAFCVIAAATLAASGAHAATAEINFVNPEKFTDVGKRYQWVEGDTALAGLRDYLVKQAAERLPADQKLVIDVTDVDLAGQYDPRQLASRQVRVVKQDHPPRMDLSFRLLAADGTVLQEGERNLRDYGFMTSPSLGFENDYLRYEKAMLEEWMQREFGKGKR
jgi:DUF3016 family protein